MFWNRWILFFGIGVKTHLSWILWNWRIEITCAQADSGLGGWRYVTPLDPRVGPGSSIDPHSWTPEQWLGGLRYVTPQGTREGCGGTAIRNASIRQLFSRADFQKPKFSFQEGIFRKKWFFKKFQNAKEKNSFSFQINFSRETALW